MNQSNWYLISNISIRVNQSKTISFDPIVFNIFYIEVAREQQTIYFMNF